MPFTTLLQADAVALVGLGAIVVVVGVSCLLRAAQRPLWYDEIYTLVLSQLDGFPGLWSALQDAVDTNPPLYYLLTGAFSHLPLPPEVSYRLPSTLGFVGFLVCLFVLVRPIAGATAALISALVPLATPLHDPYAIEARPYALLCAFLALALICWQRSNRWRFALLFACSVAVLMALHYYAVFLLAGFCLGEAILSIRRRALRPQVWLGILVGLVPLILTWPLLQAIRTYYAAGFWSKPQLDLIPQSYDALLSLQSGLGIAVALLLVLVVTTTIPPELSGVLIFFMLSPILITVSAIVTGAGMQDRYAMAPLVSAVAIASGILAARLGPRIAAGALAILLVAFGLNTVVAGDRWRGNMLEANLAQYHVQPGWLQLSRETNLPIVVADGVYYVTAYQYGDDAQRERLMTVVDPPSALNYVNTDSVDRNLMVLRRHLAVHVEDYDDFRQVRSSFLLLSPHDSNGDYFDWWARRLAFDGYTLRVQAILNRQVLYLVER